MNNISDTKLKAYILVGAIGVALILMANFTYMVLHKGFERIMVRCDQTLTCYLVPERKV
jgi:hypothetical protein